MTEDWELDFNNPPRIHPPQEGDMKNPFKGLSQPKGKRPPHVHTCCVCQQTMMEGFEIPVVTHLGCSTIQDFVCSRACQEARYVKQIRLGL